MDDAPRLQLLTTDDHDRQLAVRRGRLTRVTRGVGVDAVEWANADAASRRRTQLEAVLTAVHEHRVLSHRSAGILWGLPDTSRHDPRAHVTDPELDRTHSGGRVVRHAAALRPDEITTIDGRPVTSLPRTLVDIARSCSFEHTVAVLDFVLHAGMLDATVIRRALAEWPTARGIRRANRALDFADPASESPGESVSRVRIADDGFPAPVLQPWFETDRGAFRTDFSWPAFGIIGEFDGLVKYGGDPGTLIAEKRREEALGRHRDVRAIRRWTWSDLAIPGALYSLLRSAGLPTGL
jgi:hypothetical protein